MKVVAKPDELEAMFHDGSDESAKEMVKWINKESGFKRYIPEGGVEHSMVAVLLAKGTVDYDLHSAFVRYWDGFATRYIPSWMWVVQLPNGIFRVYTKQEMEALYLPADEYYENLIKTAQKTLGERS